VRNHQLFKKAENLNFTLLADEKGEVAGKFGVPFKAGEQSIEREIDGKKETLTRGGTAQRWTFIIGLDGKIAYKDEKVVAAEDPKKIAEAVAKLQK
jgi:peroxiredoxin Q/BCP